MGNYLNTINKKNINYKTSIKETNYAYLIDEIQ